MHLILVMASTRMQLTLGCFYLEFRDVIKEGDGLWVLRCYRYMLPMFVSSGRKNYAIETLNLLLQHDVVKPAPCRGIDLGKIYKYAWAGWQKHTQRSAL